MKRIISTLTLLQLLICFLTLSAQDAKEIIRIADAKAKGKKLRVSDDNKDREVRLDQGNEAEIMDQG